MTVDRYLRPEQILADIIEKGAKKIYLERGASIPFLFRAIVVAVDVEGGLLENPKGEGSLTHEFNEKSFQVPANIGPPNPANSVKARIISGGKDQFTHDDRLRVFWPFFPEHIAVPIKPGEYAYVMFEDENEEHGLWVNKVPGHTGVNFARGSKFFINPASSSLANKFPDTATDDKKSDKSKDTAAAQTPPDGNLSKLWSK